MSPNESKVSNPLILCDTNVIIQMTIFDSRRMFASARYSFGEIQVSPLAIAELKRWIKSENKKFKRFGKDVINLAIKNSEPAGFRIEELCEKEKATKFATYEHLEEMLTSDQKSADTSKEDKELLALAEKNNCFLATQDSTLRTLANIVINGRVLSFEDLVADLHKHGQLTYENINSGLQNLDYFQERLRFDQRKKILSLITKTEKA